MTPAKNRATHSTLCRGARCFPSTRHLGADHTAPLQESRMHRCTQKQARKVPRRWQQAPLHPATKHELFQCSWQQCPTYAKFRIPNITSTGLLELWAPGRSCSSACPWYTQHGGKPRSPLPAPPSGGDPCPQHGEIRNTTTTMTRMTTTM